MKTCTTLAIAVTLAITTACGKDKDGDKTSGAKTGAPTTAAEKAPEQPRLEFTEPVDIGAAVMAADPDDTGWKGISIKAPKGAKVDTAGGSPSLVLTDRMSIGLGGEKELTEKRQQAKESQLQKFSRFLVDEPDAILWEATDGSTSNFLLVVNVRLGDRVKSCQTEGYGEFTQANAEAILAACRGMTSK